MTRTIIRTSAWGLLSILLFAQDSNVTFRSATSLVVVSFNVERGRYYAEDLQASDFILREDGHPRGFSIFEGPHTVHPVPLELDLLFDASILPKKVKDVHTFSRWNARDTYGFLNDWDAEITQTVLHQNGIDVRLAVYHYEVNQWERLCAATNDPQSVVAAVHRILDPIPDERGELTPLPGATTPPGLFLGSPGWLEEATAATLRDAAGSSVQARHILIWFSNGYAGRMPLHTDLLAGQAAAAGITINPVIVDFANLRIATDHASGSFSVPSQTPDGATRFVNAPPTGKIGEMTGGQLFVRNHLDRDGLVQILEADRNKALSGYLVGFTPDRPGKPRKHDLEVKMTLKDKGKLVGGERSGLVY